MLLWISTTFPIKDGIVENKINIVQSSGETGCTVRLWAVTHEQ